MYDFKSFGTLVENQFNAMASGDELFVVETVDDDLWETYLASFPDGTDPIHRVRTVHDGSIDKHFIRRVGGVVSISDGKIETIWDVQGAQYPYDVVTAAMAELVRSKAVQSVFRTRESGYGARQTFSPEGEYNHFEITVPSAYRTREVGTAKGDAETSARVFKRALDELDLRSVDTVLELIDSNTLYRGEEHKTNVVAFRQALDEYRKLNSDEARSLFAWEHGTTPGGFTRFRNTVIGKLVSDLSEGQDLEKAVRQYESMVAPSNYKRPKALITETMVKKAMTTIDDLDLRRSLERRHATLSDVSVNDVLFVDRSAEPLMKDSLADSLMAETAPRKVKTGNAVSIGIDEFMDSVVPKAESIEVLVENGLKPNFVSVTAPVHEGEPRLFQWDNDFAWSYDGEVADSDIKSRVKNAGGNVTAPFRVSLGWFNHDDLDIHVSYGREHIYYGEKRGRLTGGHLDVDMNVSSLRRDAVENVCWQSPLDGVYTVSVNNFTKRESHDAGFTLEVESNGTINQYSMPTSPRSGQTVKCLEIKVEAGKVTKVRAANGLTGGGVSQDHWGVKTEDWRQVNVLLNSPNHWGDEGRGNKHWFFVLDGCQNPEPTRGIYNEFLRPELSVHRKVFEVLGSKTKCPPAEDQLSGLGFSSTKRDAVTVRVRGEVNRDYRVQF